MTQECASLDITGSAMRRWRSFGKEKKPTGSWPRRPSTHPRNAQALADILAVGIWYLACQAVQHVSTSIQHISFEHPNASGIHIPPNTFLVVPLRSVRQGQLPGGAII